MKKMSIELTFSEFALILNVLQMFEWQEDEIWDKAHINTVKRKNIYRRAVQKMENKFEEFGEIEE